MKSNIPLVSICIPTYNRSNFLLEAIRSCLDQTYKHFEIIITDNSRNDETKKAVTQLKNRRIRYYKNAKNIGPFKNLNKVISLAKGKYIKILMDDDLLHPTCLEKMVQIMESHKDVGVVMAPLKIIDEHGEQAFPKFYLVKKMDFLYKYLDTDTLIDRKVILSDFLTKTYPCCVPTGIMYRKDGFDTLGLFDERVNFAVDVEICMRFATKYNYYYINEPLTSWRYTIESATVATLHKQGIAATIFYDLVKKYISDKDIMAIFPKDQRENIIKDGYFFASKRTTLNLVAGIKSKNTKMIIDTLQIIAKNDPYISNKIKLPRVILWEIIGALIKR